MAVAMSPLCAPHPLCWLTPIAYLFCSTRDLPVVTVIPQASSEPSWSLFTELTGTSGVPTTSQSVSFVVYRSNRQHWTPALLEAVAKPLKGSSKGRTTRPTDIQRWWPWHCARVSLCQEPLAACRRRTHRHLRVCNERT